MADGRSIFRSRRMAVVFLLGFSSGLPLMLSGQTLGQWLKDGHLTTTQIAAFASVALPYTFKFLWAPLIDRYAWPFLGRRRGWLLVFQLLIVATLIAMSTLDPATDTALLALVATALATLSASQDIVVDAYNTDLLRAEERAAGSATYVMGYRTAMLMSGSLTLVMADHMAWSVVYVTMAAMMGIGIVGTLLAEEPQRQGLPPRTIAHAVVLPFVELVRRLGWRRVALVLAFAATYKFSEGFKDAVVTLFYRDLQFTKSDIGVITKAVAYPAWALGGVIGGLGVARFGLRRMLVVFGLTQALTHVCYLVVAYVGRDYVVLGTTIFVENTAYAMAAAAFVAAQMSFCSPAVSATQMALLTSFSSVGQRVFGPLAGVLADGIGWKGFFVVTIALCFPGVVFAWLANAPIAPRGSASTSSSASPA
jgi:MFS transporter, PAT family, beta-lactamase induction signal transducer AmpG